MTKVEELVSLTCELQDLALAEANGDMDKVSVDIRLLSERVRIRVDLGLVKEYDDLIAKVKLALVELKGGESPT